MKQENTVRNTIVKSIRLTPDECARIEGMAKQSNMSFNSYVVRTALEPFHQNTVRSFTATCGISAPYSERRSIC